MSDPIWEKVSVEAKELIQKMLDLDPNTRYSAQDVLEH
jgi:serine/threonine protein kinase